jgi:phenylalanyl-tRNA synthetase beta chain
MLISLNWLTHYVDVNLPARELGELFTQIGLNLEGIEESDADIVLDLEVTSNRPDCLGHLGVARELAAVTGLSLRKPEIKTPPTSGRVEDFTSVDLLAPDLCPRYTARVIRNVTVGPSPAWLIERLEAVGLRSVNNVVDVTNFVLMEYSQPLHSFDYDKLAENRIVVRRATKGETIVCIDGTACTLDESMLVIADAEKPVAVAGVMGGRETEVGERTKNILMESARFAPLGIRRTSRTLQLTSESGYRFERGVDPEAVDEASRRACAMICELAGGQLADGMIDVWAEPHQAPTVTLRPDRTNRLLGIDLSRKEQFDILDKLGLRPAKGEGGIRNSKQMDPITCTIPSFRADLTREVDLIEEIARIHGYDKITPREEVSLRIKPLGKTERVRRATIETLVAAGFDETITFSFIDAGEGGHFGFEKTLRVDPTVRKTNNVLRPTLWPSLLRACKTNQDAGKASVRLFELAAAFPPSAAGSLPEEYTQLALAATEDLRTLRGALEAVVEKLAPDADLVVSPKPLAGLADNVAAEIRLDGQVIGQIGRASAAVLDAYRLERPVYLAAVRFDALLAAAQLTRTARPLAKFPPVRRDLSLILDEPVTWGQILQAVREVSQPLRTDEQYVTTYRGKPLPKGKKSVTLALEYRSEEGTLRGEQVDEQIAELVAALGKALSAEIRT